MVYFRGKGINGHFKNIKNVSIPQKMFNFVFFFFKLHLVNLLPSLPSSATFRLIETRQFLEPPSPLKNICAKRPSEGPPDTNYLLFLSFSGTPKHCMQGRKGKKMPFWAAGAERLAGMGTSIVGHKVKDSPSLISFYWPWKVKKLRFSCN